MMLLFFLSCSRDLRDLLSFPTRRSSDLVERHRLEDGGERVVALVVGSPDPQREVDLARGTDLDRDRGGHRPSGPCSAMRAESVMASRSPRSRGPSPAARRAASARSADPAQPARAERRVLRRCPKAASTTAKTSSRLAAVAGGSRRSSRTSAESTLGTGQNTVRPMVAERCAAAYHAVLAEGTP